MGYPMPGDPLFESLEVTFLEESGGLGFMPWGFNLFFWRVKMAELK